MFDLPPIVLFGLVIALGLLLYAFAWWVVRDLPVLLRVFARVIVAIVLALPIAFLTLGSDARFGLPTSEQTSSEANKGGSSDDYAKLDDKPGPKTDKPADRIRKKTAKPPVVSKPRSEPEPEEIAEETAEETASEEVADRESEEGLGAGRGLGEEGSGSGGGGPGAPPPTTTSKKSAQAGEEKDAEKDWDVVPVYYGTDRAREPDDKRIKYNSNRGRRLELGRALVSVPREHQIPNIERPWKITIPYFNVTVYEEKEDPKKHFTMREIRALTEEDLLKLVRERLAKSNNFKNHALVFIHGYYTGFDLAVYRTAQIAYDLKFDGAPFVYTWPSGGNVASYTYDLNSAAQSEPYLRDFLKLVSQKSGAEKISIIAHSMGNQPLLRVLQDLSRHTPPEVKIDQLILAAPDVDRDNFENIAAAFAPVAKGVTLYAAANDRALDISQKFHGGVPRAGDVPPTGPVVLPGMDTIDVTAISMDSLGIRHSGYAENNQLLQDIGRLILKGERPPSVREPGLEAVDIPTGRYWKYRAAN